MSSGSSERKGGMSCAECRRSKLKCDRSFPCQSCVRRGCANLCPDATKGNKVLLAHVQRLTEQVKTAKARIKDLEHALSEAQARTGGIGPHPLLKEVQDIQVLELERIYDDIDGIHDVSDSIGSLSIGPDGKARYYGETAGSEYLHELMDPLFDQARHSKTRDPKYLGLPPEITELFNAFPFGLRGCPYTKSHFLAFVPPRGRAMELVNLYYKHVAWMYDPVVRKDFMSTIFEPIYNTTVFPSLDNVHPHRLSVFFILLACGIYFEDHPSATVLAEQYEVLARAAFSLNTILRDANCATIQAMFLIMRFIFISDRSNNEERWLLGGLCARAAQIIGLPRDSASWDLGEDEIQRRRVLFWEIFTHDAWASLVNGRPPALTLQHTDCHFPNDLSPVVKPSGDVELGFHACKFRYTICCLSSSIHYIFSMKVLPYSALLDLDKKIRQFPVPSYLQAPIQASEAGRSWSSDPSRACQQYSFLSERESNLLFIHRNSFAQALRAEPSDPLRHQYAPSVLAVYRSACRMIASLRGLSSAHPGLCTHQWFFWSGIFSSCIVLGALVIESTGCKLAEGALREFEDALPFYEEGSASCRPSATLTMLQKLLKRAQIAFTAFQAGTPLASPSPGSQSDEPDAFGLLGSRKNVISDMSSSSESPPTSNSNMATRSSLPQQPHPSMEVNQGRNRGRNPNPPMHAQFGHQQYDTGPPISSSLSLSSDYLPFSDQAAIASSSQQPNDYDVFMSFVRASGGGGGGGPRRALSEPDHAPSHHEYERIEQPYIPTEFCYHPHPQQQAQPPPPPPLPHRIGTSQNQPLPADLNIDLAMMNEHNLNQGDIWPSFIRDLGLTGERA